MDKHETEIKLPVKLHFTYQPHEPMTYHSPEVCERVDIEVIEIGGYNLPWSLTKEILAENHRELEDEILESRKK